MKKATNSFISVIAVKTVLATAQKLIRNGIPSHILYFGESFGDNLLLTVLARALGEKQHKKIWVKCDNTELFKYNNDISLVIPLNTLLSKPLLSLFRIKLVHPTYTVYDPVLDKDAIPEKHITLKMADYVNLKGTINTTPVMVLDGDEEKKGYYAPCQLVIATSSINARVPMRNKEWFVEKYQEVVERFKDEYTIIQLGAKNDYPLTGVVDLRGKTSVRESAAILKNSRLMIAHVGFLMHLARAVDCPSVIIYGGREKPEQSGYSAFRNIYTDVECSPCWQHNLCHYDRKCMMAISVDRVCEIIADELKQEKQPLKTDLLLND